MHEEIKKADLMHNMLLAFERAETITFKKNLILTAEGQVENDLYFIEDGAVKVYYQSELEEHIVRLGYNGSTINSLSSFYNRKPSELFVETIRESKIKTLKRNQVLDIVSKSSGYPKFLEELIIQQLDRELDLLHHSPLERLERVLERSPLLFQYIPLKYIASYLRMSPETLSRIRKS